MMGKTHKAAGCLAMLFAYEYMSKHNLLLDSVNPLVQLMIMYPACSWGSTAPDLDQGDDAIPEKTPISILVHKIIYLGKVRHRSWQTHSPWMFIVINAVIWALWYALSVFGTAGGIVCDIDLTILRLIFVGFGVGFASHLIADTFTYQGIPLTKKHHLRLVPKVDMFKTNTKYETVVRYLIYIAIVVIVVFRLLMYFGILV